MWTSEVFQTNDFSRSTVSLAIFLSRESLTVCISTLQAAYIAIPESGRIELLVNGNTSLAQELGEFLKNGSYQRIRVWDIPLGDKGNAWNVYIHNVWLDECVAFFIDGYVRLFPDSLERLYQTLFVNPDAYGGCGVPSTGRTANAMRLDMIKNGGFHGNLCCLTCNAISELKRRKIKIVLGIYRVDSLMGAFLCYGLDETSKVWNPKRIVVDATASWDVDEKRWWRWTDVKAKLRQIERQLRGKMENAAIKNFFMVQHYHAEDLPIDCYTLIEHWATSDPNDYRMFFYKNPLSVFAFRRFLWLNHSFKQAGVTYLLSIDV